MSDVVQREKCWCGTRTISGYSAYHYFEDKPVCSSACYRAAIQTLPAEMDGYCMWGGDNESVEQP